MKNRLGRASSIFWGVLLLLAVLSVLVLILSCRSWFWFEDFLANFLAGLVVAVLVFLFVDLFFGLTKRKEQEDRARQQAQVFLDLEIAQNRTFIEDALTNWRKGEPKSIHLKEDGWIDLKKSALFTMLPHELIGILSATYLTLQELRARLWHWQQMGPEWNIQRPNGTKVPARDEWREATIRMAEASIDLLDKAFKALHK